MALTVGGAPVNAVYVGSTPVLEVYVGSQKIWPTTRETVQITLGTTTQARDQLRSALADRGLDYQTVTEIPFDIELVGSGSVQQMFNGCTALTHAPDLDTSQVTSMSFTFSGCASLTYVPDMDTAQATDTRYMFNNCAALTDGNVRLIGRHPDVNTSFMITGSGLTREPWYTADGKPIDVYQVTLTNVSGHYAEHPLVTVTVPAGETWSVRVQGTVTKAPSESWYRPSFRIGTTKTGPYAQGATVDMTGTVTSTNPKIVMIAMGGPSFYTSFTGTVTIEK